MEDNLILEGLLSMVTELKDKQEQQATPASPEEVINRLDVIEQRILVIQNKPAISENTVQEILNQIASIKKEHSDNQKQDLDNIKIRSASPLRNSVILPGFRFITSSCFW